MPPHKEGKGCDRDRPRPKSRVLLPITGHHHLATDPKRTSNHPAEKIISPKSQQFTSGTTRRCDDSPDLTYTTQGMTRLNSLATFSVQASQEWQGFFIHKARQTEAESTGLYVSYILTDLTLLYACWQLAAQLQSLKGTLSVFTKDMSLCNYPLNLGSPFKF